MWSSESDAVHRQRGAAWRELEALPANRIGEIIDGVLHVSPLLPPRAALTKGALGGQLWHSARETWFTLFAPGLRLVGAPEVFPTSQAGTPSAFRCCPTSQ